MDDYALMVWRFCVLKKARAQSVSAKYRDGILTEDWLRDLARWWPHRGAHAAP